MRVDSLIGGRLCRQRSPGRVLTPAPPCRASLVTAGAEHRGSPRVPVPSGDYRRGAGRTDELREPPLMPRDEYPRRWDR